MASPFDPALTNSEILNVFPNLSELQCFPESGQGTVYKALDQENRQVVLKIFPPVFITRAQREVIKTISIDSDHFAEIYDYGEIIIRGQQCYFIITKYERGEDLKKYLRMNGKMDEDQIRTLLIDMASTIDILWLNRIVHCDIKPGNILLDSEGHYKIIDLGIAKYLDDTTITVPRGRLGTPGYMAPEQGIQRKNFTLRVDLFALGLVSYELTTGIHPFNKNQDLIDLPNILPRPISNFVSVDPRIENVIMTLLNKNPIFRPISGSAVISML